MASLLGSPFLLVTCSLRWLGPLGLLGRLGLLGDEAVLYGILKCPLDISSLGQTQCYALVLRFTSLHAILLRETQYMASLHAGQNANRETHIKGVSTGWDYGSFTS